jgi:hypothetical protein
LGFADPNRAFRFDSPCGNSQLVANRKLSKNVGANGVLGNLIIEASLPSWRSVRVPGVYPASANLHVWLLLSLRRINNLWKLYIAFFRFPPAPPINFLALFFRFVRPSQSSRKVSLVKSSLTGEAYLVPKFVALDLWKDVRDEPIIAQFQ